MLQGELAALTAQQQQLTASESASRQQLAASVQDHEQATAACTSAEAELHRVSAALQDSEAQLVHAHQKEAQVSILSPASWGPVAALGPFLLLLGLYKAFKVSYQVQQVLNRQCSVACQLVKRMSFDPPVIVTALICTTCMLGQESDWVLQCNVQT